MYPFYNFFANVDYILTLKKNDRGDVRKIFFDAMHRFAIWVLKHKSIKIFGLQPLICYATTTPLWAYKSKFGPNCPVWPLLGPFYPEGQYKRHFWIHFLVALIYGGFWEIMGPLTHPFGELWALLGAYKSKFGPNWPVLPLLDPFHPEWHYKRHLLIHFLVVLIYGGFWEILGPLT